jgi:hypothetical protein
VQRRARGRMLAQLHMYLAQHRHLRVSGHGVQPLQRRLHVPLQRSAGNGWRAGGTTTATTTPTTATTATTATTTATSSTPTGDGGGCRCRDDSVREKDCGSLAV